MAKEIEEDVRSRFLLAIETLTTQDGLNAVKIMEALGDYKQALTQMRAGTRYPTLSNIVMLCNVYGVRANWLLFNEGTSGLKRQRKRTMRQPISGS